MPATGAIRTKAPRSHCNRFRMPSLSPTSSTFRRRAARTLIAKTVLAALVALPRARRHHHA
ncbi:glycoprotein, partial [Ralstonia solanacearum]